MTTTNCRMLPEVLVMGVPSVDAQHESLFCGIENLKFRCLEANELQLALFNALLDELREHFHTEELIARTAGIDFVEHAEMHCQTLITLNAWGEQVSSGQRDVFSFLRYLEIWFERHIREEDLPFAKQLIVAQVNVGGL